MNVWSHSDTVGGDLYQHSHCTNRTVQWYSSLGLFGRTFSIDVCFVISLPVHTHTILKKETAILFILFTMHIRGSLHYLLFVSYFCYSFNFFLLVKGFSVLLGNGFNGEQDDHGVGRTAAVVGRETTKKAARTFGLENL